MSHIHFVILTAPRAGSNMLCTLLNSHPDILCHHEIFNENGIFYALHLRNTEFSLGSMEERERDPIAFLGRVWEHSLGYKVIGFKLNNYQNEPILRAVLRDTTIKKIILRRRNRVKSYVSWLISNTLHQWEVYRGETLVTPRPMVHVDPTALQDSIRFADAFYADVDESLQKTNQCALSVTYEELFGDAERTRILSYLDVQSVPKLRVDSVKQNSPDLRDSVSNFTQLHAVLKGSALETQLLDCGV